MSIPETEAVGDGSSTPIQPVALLRVLPTYSGQPLVVHFDGGHREGVGTTRVVILKPGTTTLTYTYGEYENGSSLNHAELYAVFKGLQLVISKC